MTNICDILLKFVCFLAVHTITTIRIYCTLISHFLDLTSSLQKLGLLNEFMYGEKMYFYVKVIGAAASIFLQSLTLLPEIWRQLNGKDRDFFSKITVRELLVSGYTLNELYIIIQIPALLVLCKFLNSVRNNNHNKNTSFTYSFMLYTPVWYVEYYTSGIWIFPETPVSASRNIKFTATCEHFFCPNLSSPIYVSVSTSPRFHP